VPKLSIIAFAGALSIAATTPALAAQSAPANAGAARPAAAQQQQASTRASVVKGLDTNFKTVDTNGDGNLSSTELAAAEGKVQQRRIAARRTQHEATFTRLDTNKDGSLSKAEFMAAAPNAASAAPNGAALVTRLDANKDGRVTAEEYRAPVLATFDRADTNKDGVLSEAERKAVRN
jgi:Ca2+-binding EF-hand superfamily protein